MNNVLRIDSSLFAENGVSSLLADYLEGQLKARHPELEVNQLVLSKDPVPYIDGSWMAAFMTPADELTEEQKQKVSFSDDLIENVKKADALIVSAPMYNFNIPATLRSWFDVIARAGKTFNYTENGPVGLLEDKPVYVITTRGGLHKDQPTDIVVSHLKTMFGFLGLTQVNFIYSEQLSFGPEFKDKSIENAKVDIQKLVA